MEEPILPEGLPEEKILEKKPLFGKPKAQAAGVENIVPQLNTLMGRLRVLEERFTMLNRKIEVIERNMLNEHKKVDTEIKAINAETAELKRGVDGLSDKIGLITNELKNFAGKDDIEVIKKYIEMWEPLNFATKKEVARMIEEACKGGA